MEILYLIGIIGWVIAAWKWSQWNHVVLYHSSAYLMIMGNLLHLVVTVQYTLWRYESPTLELNSTMIDLAITLVAFPCSVILYLSHYPERVTSQIGYIFLWVFIYSGLEGVTHLLGLITYHNGWNFWWSILINALAFSVLRINHSAPWLAYILFIGFSAIFIVIFKVPIHELK